MYKYDGFIIRIENIHCAIRVEIIKEETQQVVCNNRKKPCLVQTCETLKSKFANLSELQKFHGLKITLLK